MPPGRSATAPSRSRRRPRTAPRRTRRPGRSQRGAAAPANSRSVLVATLLERLAEDPRAAALLLDVTGPLPPTAAPPDLAAVPEATRPALQRPAGRYPL